MMKKIFVSMVLAVGVALSAQAQDSFVVATGDFKGGSTYSRMYKEFAARCSRSTTGSGPTLSELETTGSVKNGELLTGNQVNGAFVQSDILFFQKMTDEAKVSNIRTLFALHPEELHFVARADTKKEGGILGFGGTNISYNTIADLKGRTVGAVGGSVLSANVVSNQSKLNFRVQEFPNNQAMTNALLEGKIDSILAVGGAPHALIASLDQRFRLLPVSEDVSKALASVYHPAKLSYGNLNQAGVPALSTQALFVTRTYRSVDTQKELLALRECFVRKLPDIQDSRGTHPKWQAVNADDKGKWAYYDLK